MCKEGGACIIFDADEIYIAHYIKEFINFVYFKYSNTFQMF